LVCTPCPRLEPLTSRPDNEVLVAPPATGSQHAGNSADMRVGQPAGMERIRFPARTGMAVDVDANQRLTIIDVDGGQVGDFFAFHRTDPTEHLSASHTRAFNSRLFAAVGDAFMSSLRRPMLRVLADTSPGHHDMLIAACDPARYRQLGVVGWHPSYAENLARSLGGRGVTLGFTPQPFNVFMRTIWLSSLTS
jgi:uncharacterized protein YcgI (DUF1989 family)